MICAGEERSEFLPGILAADCAMYDSDMGAIVDVNCARWKVLQNCIFLHCAYCTQLTFIVAIEIQRFESKHETLQN